MNGSGGRPMRVLLVTKGLDIGGIERIVVDLAGGLAKRGCVVEVAVVNDRRDRLVGALGTDIVLHRLGGSDRIGFGASRRLAHLVTSDRFDVVHVHGPLPATVARLTRHHRPIVTTSHTLWSALRWYTRVAWRATVRQDAAVVAVSAAVAASLPRAVSDRVIVLPHGVDPSSIRDAAALAAAERATRDLDGTSPSPEVTAIAVASHRDVKNYPNLLRGVKIAREHGARLRLIAVGEGPDLELHRALAAELGLADVVEFRPPVPNVLALIASADLLVVASDYEGQPLVVLEALALGLPVVATAVGRVPELVGPAAGRVVRPGLAEPLGLALAEVANDSELRARMGEAALRDGQTWTLDDVIDAHLRLYEEVRLR